MAHSSDEQSLGAAESTRDSRRRSDESAGTSPRDKNQSLCAFWLGERCFALDTPLVGEVVTVEDKIFVPLSPPAVRGLFNLRGEPVPLVALSELLGVAAERRATKTTTAIVVRSGDLVAGLIADRMEAVIPAGRGRLIPPANAEEDRVILGFLELADGELTTVVSVLDPSVVLERLSALRFLKQASASA